MPKKPLTYRHATASVWEVEVSKISLGYGPHRSASDSRAGSSVTPRSRRAARSGPDDRGRVCTCTRQHPGQLLVPPAATREIRLRRTGAGGSRPSRAALAVARLRTELDIRGARTHH